MNAPTITAAAVLDIPSAPLDEGDPIHGDTFVDIPGALGGEESGDIVAFAVPSGKGLVFQKWVERKCFGRVDDGTAA